jgi:hypothetical protein
MECLMVLLNEPASWDHARKAIADPAAFLDRLKYFRVEDTSEKVVRRASDKYVSRPDFLPDHLRQFSMAASVLCQWARTATRYAQQQKVGGPRRAKLAYAEEQYAKRLAEFKLEFGTAKPVNRQNLVKSKGQLAQEEKLQADTEVRLTGLIQQAKDFQQRKAEERATASMPESKQLAERLAHKNEVIKKLSSSGPG